MAREAVSWPLVILKNTGFLKSFWKSQIRFHIIYYKGKVADPVKDKLVGLTQILGKTEEWFIQDAIRKKNLKVGVEVMPVSMVCEKKVPQKI